MKPNRYKLKTYIYIYLYLLNEYSTGKHINKLKVSIHMVTGIISGNLSEQMIDTDIQGPYQ